tara:strand:+ start:269 stop:1063 length:795 start_codon:yes stop_codon:yes gene_type:complete
MSETYKYLTIDHHGDHITSVTFNRAKKANALNRDFLLEIEEMALSFRDDIETRVVIFTGQGKHFSGGADLQETIDKDLLLLARRRNLRLGERAIKAICNMDQISIAAWNGAAMGGGACLAIAMDFRLGTPTSQLGFPEVDLGMNLMWKSLPLMVQLVGPARAKRLVAGGERIDAEKMLDWGILDEVVPSSELSFIAKKWAKLYASKPPIAVQMIKQSVNAISLALGESLMHMDVDQHLLAQNSKDYSLAVGAQLSNSDPIYEGD